VVDAAAEKLTIHTGSFSSEGRLEADRRAGFRDDGRPASRCQYWAAEGVLLWTVHHALLDGRSIAEVLTHLLSLLAGIQPPAPPEWFGCLATDDGESARARSAMESIAMVSREDEEPLAWEPGQAGIPWRVRVPLPAGLRQRLDARAAECGSTSHGLVQWAWAWAVARLGGYDQVALGVVRSAHWTVPQGRRAAGYLMTTVPIPARMEKNLTLGDALRLYREAVLVARDFTRSDPREMAKGLGRPAGNLWDAVVMTENASLEELVLPHLPDGLVSSIEIHERTGEPLTASAWLGIRPEIDIEALPERFSEPAAKHLAATWLKAIHLVADADFDTPLEKFDPLSDECLAQIAAHETDGPALAPGFGGIWQAFREAAMSTPDSPAGISRGVTTTYAELMAAAESLAAALWDAGVRPGDAVASRIDDRTHAPVVVLACARIQAVYMPLDADIPPDRLRSMHEIAEPKALVSDVPGSGGAPRIDPGKLKPGATPPTPFEPHDAWLPFCLLFTSGSTGEPKGVINHHHGILNEVLAIGQMLGFRKSDRVLQFASLGFDAALEEILGTLLAGACLVPREEFILESFERYQEFLITNSITVADLPTAYWAGWCAWLDANKASPPAGVRAVIIGGEKAGAGSTDAWRRSCGGSIPVFNTYGPTETAIVATAAPLVIPSDGSDPPIGRPLPGLKVRIVDATGRVAPSNRPGELWLGGAGVGLGYLKRPEATAAVFVPGERPGIPAWYRTGDVASMDETSVLHFLGRVDDQVKIRGKRIEPDEIRARLETVEGVRQAHVGAPLIEGRRQLVAWVVATASEEEIRTALRRELPGWMVPSAFVFLDSLPLNARGKVDRRSLPAPVLPEKEEESGSEDSLETWMASVFAEVLEIEPSSVRRSADFAEQGGDSLSAMILATRLAKAGVDLQPGELAVDSSPRLLAERIRQGYGKSRTSWEPILQLRSGDPGKTPLVLIHATPGDVLGYANLATELPSSLPCLGLVSKGLHLPDEAHGSIEEMATAYIEALRPRLAGHPWILGGWCYGGIVAYEMARQLVAAGEPAPFVILIEAFAETPADPSQAKRLKLAKLAGLLKKPLKSKISFLKQRFAANQTSATPAKPADDGFSRSVIYQANMRAIDCYFPQSYQGELQVLLSEEDDGGMPVRHGGWHVLGARCVTHRITGGHHLALRPPHVSMLAATIAALLESQNAI
jgi:amino acid adenylation domain-containing protein